MSVVGAPEIAQQAELIQAERLGKKEYLPVGQTQLAIYPVAEKPEEYRAVVVVQENWQPLMEQAFVADKAFIANVENLSETKEIKLFNGLKMTVRTFTPPEGGEPYEVAILIPGSTEYLVISTEYMDHLFAGPISELVEPGSVNLGTLTYRVQEDFEREGKIIPSALVGEIQDLSLIVPATVVQEAFDVSPKTMDRSVRIHLTTTGYKRVLNLKLAGTPFWKFFVNSGYVVLMNIFGHFISCTLVAYGFARLRGPGKNLLFVILLGTMMVPYTIVTLPTYLVFRNFGLLGTMIPLWIRSFFGNAFLIFVLRQFFLTLPYELDEAAILDGATRFQVLTKVILPLSKPALATVGIFTFWWHWNSFLDPLIYIGQQKYYTITLAMNSFNQLYARSAGYYDRILSGSVLSLLPMVIIFILAQRYFIEGIQMQGLKR
jgi:multiple sugar transport system permease protein